MDSWENYNPPSIFSCLNDVNTVTISNIIPKVSNIPQSKIVSKRFTPKTQLLKYPSMINLRPNPIIQALQRLNRKNLGFITMDLVVFLTPSLYLINKLFL